MQRSDRHIPVVDLRGVGLIALLPLRRPRADPVEGPPPGVRPLDDLLLVDAVPEPREPDAPRGRGGPAPVGEGGRRPAPHADAGRGEAGRPPRPPPTARPPARRRAAG